MVRSSMHGVSSEELWCGNDFEIIGLKEGEDKEQQVEMIY